MFKFAALYILGCPKIFSQMKWDLNERRRVTKKLILKFRSHAILKNIFHIIKKCFFISPGDLYLLFTMNFHVFLRTSKVERFQFKDSKINWNILSLSNVVYVDKKKKKRDQCDRNCRNNILFLVVDPRIHFLSYFTAYFSMLRLKR